MKELNIGFNRKIIYLKILEFLNIVESKPRKIVARFYQDYGLNNFKYALYDSSESSKENKEYWISQNLIDYYNRVKTILHKNMSLLNELAHELQIEDTLNKKQLK